MVTSPLNKGLQQAHFVQGCGKYEIQQPELGGGFKDCLFSSLQVGK